MRRETVDGRIEVDGYGPAGVCQDVGALGWRKLELSQRNTSRPHRRI
ncbi:MAG: hypothetical protein HUU41_02730 [Bryobacteraceae bacterium]|nr:hypothetical protein [Bryobacteraceae bacterium]